MSTELVAIERINIKKDNGDAVQHLPAQRRHRQGRIGRYLTISRSGQKKQ